MLADPGGQEPLACALVAGAFVQWGADPAEVVADLRDRLGRTPAHVESELINDAAELRRWLAPFQPAPDGLAEIRKRIHWRLAGRHGLSLAVEPFTAAAPGGGFRPEAGAGWPAVGAELARQPRPTLLSVYVEPYAVRDVLRFALDSLAGEYAARALPQPSPILYGPREPDPFAQWAAPVYADAARRYRERAFRVRVSVASAGRLEGALPELVARAVSPPAGESGSSWRGGAVSRPVEWVDLAAAWDNIALTRRDWLDATYRQGIPFGALSEPERILCDLADGSEAAALLRLPGAEPGWPTPFTRAGSAADPRPRDEPGPGPGYDRVVVCHADADATAAAGLYGRLRRDGHHPWSITADVLPGQDGRLATRAALARARAVVVALSRHAVSSRGVLNAHILWALETAEMQPEGDIFIIPARLEPCAVPARLEQWRAVDLFRPDGYDRLTAALGSLRP